MTAASRLLRERALDEIDALAGTLRQASDSARRVLALLNDSRHHDLAHLTVVDTRRLTETAEAHDGGASQASTERRADT